jgi:hypothetical protein
MSLHTTESMSSLPRYTASILQMKYTSITNDYHQIRKHPKQTTYSAVSIDTFTYCCFAFKKITCQFCHQAQFQVGQQYQQRHP